MAFLLDDINQRAQRDPSAFIRECDAEFDAKVRYVADMIEKNREKSPIVLMSGPSGSGKTTTSKKIEEELLRRGINTYALPMDNYFRTIDDNSPRTANGELDLESPKCVDMELLSEHFCRLSRGERVVPALLRGAPRVRRLSRLRRSRDVPGARRWCGPPGSPRRPTTGRVRHGRPLPASGARPGWTIPRDRFR